MIVSQTYKTKYGKTHAFLIYDKAFMFTIEKGLTKSNTPVWSLRNHIANGQIKPTKEIQCISVMSR